MQKLVECVPNFSEGRDKSILDAIAAEISGVEGANLLDLDPGAATNRTVFTLVGSPEAVAEAAFRAIRKAAELIDMSKHKGAHPRMGATDVCPFVPVSNVTMEECAEIARRVGDRVGRELGLPVYLYEKAASRPERESLASIRSGEYEGLSEKLKDPVWAPDFGPAVFNPRSGATAIGAREFLIAYNVNLNTRDRKLANEIAFTIRETGRLKKDAKGNQVLDAQGNKAREEGLLPAVRAVGWYIEEYGCAQVSINLLNYNTTPPHVAFDACVDEARKLGLRVTGSELVGLIPRAAILQAGTYYLEKQGKSSGVPERELVHVAVHSLGLAELGPFDPDQKVIEYRIRRREGSLVEMTARAFVDELSTDSPAPGGGSVAALCGALSGALGAMVANLTVGKKGLESSWEPMKAAARRGQELKDWFLTAVDEDTAAFNRVMDAFRLPGKTPDDAAIKEKAVQDATKQATEVPLSVLQRSLEALALAEEAALLGNPNSVSDAGVAAHCARTCAEGAWLNVCINLKNLTDTDWVASVRGRANEFRRRAAEHSAAILTSVESRMGV
jgi:glutamate formiminotransferase / formiminotetrahydrofolate cyclodeaminase